MSPLRAVLLATRERIADPRRWVQGTWCGIRDQHGNVLNFWQHRDKARANCWCLGAALSLAIDGHGNDDWTIQRTEAEYLLLSIVERRGWGTWPNVSCWNDNQKTSHADVLSVLDEALAGLPEAA